ncbi:MAG: hypothetical protein AAF840_15615, partial [Bacteroidota bacterium]
MKQWNWWRKLAIWWLIGLTAIAIFSDFLANDRPLVVKMEGEIRFPVLRQYSTTLGWSSGYSPVVRDWYEADVAWALWPPVPYAAGASDLKNSGYRSPFAPQNTGERARHYLGTDQLGKDTLAGLIVGCRTAIMVGIGAVLISLIIGIFLGGIAGFFGNDGLRNTRAHWWGWSLGGMGGLLY